MFGSQKPIYERVLLKMSGEALMGSGKSAIDPAVLDRIASEINEIRELGVEIAIVVGGGNFFRGAALSEAGINRITGDYMGMLATMMNALALRDALERVGMDVRILSALPMSGVTDQFHRRKAMPHLSRGRVVIFAAGTGNPLVTTDSAASLRGIEIEADAIIKATQVDGIYSADPAKNAKAQLYRKLTYKEALSKELAVMDLSAFCQCRDHGMTLVVVNLHKPHALKRAILGEEEGTVVKNGN